MAILLLETLGRGLGALAVEDQSHRQFQQPLEALRHGEQTTNPLVFAAIPLSDDAYALIQQLDGGLGLFDQGHHLAGIQSVGHLRDRNGRQPPSCQDAAT